MRSVMDSSKSDMTDETSDATEASARKGKGMGVSWMNDHSVVAMVVAASIPVKMLIDSAASDCSLS